MLGFMAVGPDKEAWEYATLVTSLHLRAVPTVLYTPVKSPPTD